MLPRSRTSRRTPQGSESPTRARRARTWALDHPVATSIAAALLLRVLLAVSAHAWGPPTLVPDEQLYVELATVVANGRPPSSWMSGYGASLFASTWVFTAPLAGLFWVLEPSRLIGQLLAAVFGAVTAGLTARLGQELRSPAMALTAGLVVAVLPSQIFWSSIVLRESMVWAALAALGLATALSARRRFGPALVLAAAGLLSLGFLRTQTMLVAGIALVIAAALIPRDRLVRVAAALVLALVVPALAGTGLGGVTLVTAAVPSLGATRSALAQGAASGLHEPLPADARLPAPEESGEESGALEIARRGTSLAESGVSEAQEGLSANLRALPTGLAGFLLRPLPGEQVRTFQVLLTQVENVLWYAAYLACLASCLVFRRYRSVTAFPFVLLIGLTSLNAIVQGNVGTAFRHRGQVAWAVAILATVGVFHLASRRRATRSGADTAAPGGTVDLSALPSNARQPDSLRPARRR